MKILKEGDKGQGICHHCQKRVNKTYLIRDVPFEDGAGVVNGVLAGVCDECDRVISTPAQSTPRIREALEKKERSLEVRVPKHLIDILMLTASQLGVHQRSFNNELLKVYVSGLVKEKAKAKKLKNFLSSDLAIGAKNTDRISFKVSESFFSKIENLQQLSDLKNTSDLIRCIVLQINEDFLQSKKPPSSYYQSAYAVAQTYH